MKIDEKILKEYIFDYHQSDKIGINILDMGDLDINHIGEMCENNGKLYYLSDGVMLIDVSYNTWSYELDRWEYWGGYFELDGYKRKLIENRNKKLKTII